MEAAARQAKGEMTRLRLRLRGAVQGVGFRPFAYGLAARFALGGFVRNDAEGVTLEVEGEQADEFVAALRSELPPLARLDDVEIARVAPRGERAFVIETTQAGRRAHPHPRRRRDLREMPRRSVRSVEPFLSLSLRQLHPLRPALHADAAAAL